MTKTLEEIKGMNIPVGAPIEVTINTSLAVDLTKMPNNKTYKELGYYQGISNDDKLAYGTLLYEPSTRKNPNEPPHGVLIPLIENITIK